MDKVRIKLENCYGIKKMQTEFDFTESSAYIVYASNGSMKTSFSKTLKDISENKEPKEEVFGREPFFELLDERDETVDPENIFVVESYDSEYSSKNMTSLLMNKLLQEQYKIITNDIIRKKMEFFNTIQESIGSKVKFENEILDSFEEDNFFDLLITLHSDNINELPSQEIDFTEIDYTSLFNDKVKEFVEKDIEGLILQYSKQYEALIEKSQFLKKGDFSQHNAKAVNKTLNDNGFFKAGHEIFFRNGNKVNSADEFAKMLQEEKDTIFGNSDLCKIFDKIDYELSKNIQLRNFKKIIENNPDFIVQLIDYSNFKKKIWIGLLKKYIVEVNELVTEFNRAKKEIRIIQIEAEAEKYKWHEVLEIFSKRFYVPFNLFIDNQKDVILNDSVPSITFKYKDADDEIEIERSKLTSILSGGERRALYLLNIIFELEGLKVQEKKTLIIADDIAESFDYKNKYAIIEYLMELSSCGYFNFVILTHNFDFYRTVGTRMIPHRKYCVMVVKNEKEVILKEGKYLKDIFAQWKNKFDNDDKILVATIPFIRNIVEYIDSPNSTDYDLLTSLLHLKNYSETKTKEITFKKLESIINKVWRTEKNISNEREDESVFDLILKTADKIALDSTLDELELENKIVLSMGIRLLAEEFMIQQLIDNNYPESAISSIKTSQTGKLLSFYIECSGTNKKMIKSLEEVCLMTSENIHLNSFMYEPLIDVSIHQLKLLHALFSSLRPSPQMEIIYKSYISSEQLVEIN